MRRENWLPDDNSVLCSAHFDETSFNRLYVNMNKLCDYAIPTIFKEFPVYLQKVCRVHIEGVFRWNAHKIILPQNLFK